MASSCRFNGRRLSGERQPLSVDSPIITWTCQSAAKVSGAVTPRCPLAPRPVWVPMSFRKWVGVPESAGKVLWALILSVHLSARGVVADAVFCPVLGRRPPTLFLHPLAAGLRCTLGYKVGTEPTGRTGPTGPPPQITDLKGGSRRVIRGNTSLGPRHAPAGSGPQRFWSPSSREGPSRGNPRGRVGSGGWGGRGGGGGGRSGGDGRFKPRFTWQKNKNQTN